MRPHRTSYLGILDQREPATPKCAAEMRRYPDGYRAPAGHGTYRGCEVEMDAVELANAARGIAASQGRVATWLDGLAAAKALGYRR